MKSTALTVKQNKIFGFIYTFVACKGYGPTTRQIADHIGVKSSNTALVQMKALRTKAAITFNEKIRGSVRPVKGFKVIIKGEK